MKTESCLTNIDPPQPRSVGTTAKSAKIIIDGPSNKINKKGVMKRELSTKGNRRRKANKSYKLQNRKKRTCSSLRTLQDLFVLLGLIVWLTLQTRQSQFGTIFDVSRKLHDQEEHKLLSAHFLTQQLWKNALNQQESLTTASSLTSLVNSSPHSRAIWNWKNSIRNRYHKPSGEFFSACLIVKDDNHWLIEWLAYHYHVLPLRHLVLVNDPQSYTTPTKILDRWNDKIQIDVWMDKDFMPEWLSKKGANLSSVGLWMHLNRQKHFYGQCLQHLQKQGRNWVALIDTDEFIRINPILHPMPFPVRSRSGHILSFLEHQLKINKIDDQDTTIFHNRITKNKTVCLLAPRIQIASIETNLTEKPPKPFQADGFLTYRWLYHNGEEMPAGKNIIKLNHNEPLPKAAHSVHHVLEHCPRNTPGEATLTDPSKILLIQHYLGTLEQFTYRDDPRDAVDDRPMRWHSRGRFPEATIRDAGMTAWLHGLVTLEGKLLSQQLLKDVGKVEQSYDFHRRNQSLVRHGAFNTTLVREHLDRMQQVYTNVEPFSACLVIMDDNHFLIEWLAYHFHVLPLKRLIYVQDPHSRTDSTSIFARWSGRIEIARWYDEQFLPKHIRKKYQAGNVTDAALHRYRQKFFFAPCLREFHLQNSTWVMLTDTDEFIRPNTRAMNAKMPPVSKSGAISRFLQSQLRANRVVSGARDASKKCLYIPRFQIAAKEIDTVNTTVKSIDTTLGKGYESEKFLTLRWRYHNGNEIVLGAHNLDGKNIIDVSRIDIDDIPNQIYNVHHVLPEYCPTSNGGKRVEDRDSWLLINHYLGSYEQFSFRQDPRDKIKGRPKRNYEQWSTIGQNPPPTIVDEDITPWLLGFIRSVGPIEARRLLKYVGETKPNKTTIVSTLAKKLGMLS